jgi:hypothetical protein
MATMRIERTRAEWGFWLQWVLASILGFAMGAAIGNVVTDLIFTALFGAMGGFMQWLVLRRQLTRAGWWVPTHLLGSLVGGGLGIVAFHAMSLIGLYQFTWTAAGAMFGAGLGTITGIALVCLLRKSISEV